MQEIRLDMTVFLQRLCYMHFGVIIGTGITSTIHKKPPGKKELDVF